MGAGFFALCPLDDAKLLESIEDPLGRLFSDL
jgi:hypothetical protein